MAKIMKLIVITWNRQFFNTCILHVLNVRVQVQGVNYNFSVWCLPSKDKKRFGCKTSYKYYTLTSLCRYFAYKVISISLLTVIYGMHFYTILFY